VRTEFHGATGAFHGADVEFHGATGAFHGAAVEFRDAGVELHGAGVELHGENRGFHGAGVEFPGANGEFRRAIASSHRSAGRFQNAIKTDTTTTAAGSAGFLRRTADGWRGRACSLLPRFVVVEFAVYVLQELRCNKATNRLPSRNLRGEPYAESDLVASAVSACCFLRGLGFAFAYARYALRTARPMVV
jgi:hypothetical protein